jgi:hypothetical protein
MNFLHPAIVSIHNCIKYTKDEGNKYTRISHGNCLRHLIDDYYRVFLEELLVRFDRNDQNGWFIFGFHHFNRKIKIVNT